MVHKMIFKMSKEELARVQTLENKALWADKQARDLRADIKLDAGGHVTQAELAEEKRWADKYMALQRRHRAEWSKAFPEGG